MKIAFPVAKKIALDLLAYDKLIIDHSYLQRSGVLLASKTALLEERLQTSSSLLANRAVVIRALKDQQLALTTYYSKREKKYKRNNRARWTAFFITVGTTLYLSNR